MTREIAAAFGTAKSLITKFFVLLAITGYFNHAHSDQVENDPNDYSWTHRQFDESTIIASTPGITMFGDQLRIRIIKDSCDYGNLWTSVYTIPDETVSAKTFEGKKVSSTFMGEKLSLPVIHAGKFILGYLVMLDMGVYKLDTLVEILSKHEVLEITYQDSSDFKSSNYFDIPFNSWSTLNLKDTVTKASQECKSLTSGLG